MGKNDGCCEAKNSQGQQCKRAGNNTRTHSGQEYRACTLHNKAGFKPFKAKGPERKARVIGYLRVSTGLQETAKNKADVLAFTNDKKLGHVEFVEETVSGTKDWKKRKLGEVLDELVEGDIIVTPELSRLGRSVLQILEIMKKAGEKGVIIYAIKGAWNNVVDSLESKIVLTMLSLAAEIERELIVARTVEGMAAKKAAGVKMGRPKGIGKSKLDQYRPEIEALLANGSAKSFIAKRYGCTEATLHNWLKKHKINIAAKP